MPKHNIEGRSCICRKPASLAEALRTVATAATALQQHRQNYQGTQYEAQVDGAVLAGGRCRSYFAEYFGQYTNQMAGQQDGTLVGQFDVSKIDRRPLFIKAAVALDLETFAANVEEALQKTQLAGQKGIASLLTSAIEQVKLVMEDLATSTPVQAKGLRGQQGLESKAPFAASQTNGLTLLFIAGVTQANVSVAQQLATSFAQASNGTNMASPEMDTLQVNIGRGITVQFQSAGELALFGNETTLCQKFGQELNEFMSSIPQLEGIESFGANRHQVTLRFRDVPLTAVVTSTSDLTEYSSAQEFFGIVAGQLKDYTESAPQIDTKQYPYAAAEWGTPLVIGSTGRQAKQSQAVGA